MRARFILLVLAILLIAGFAALNWSEFTRPSPLLFGAVVMDAPLGLIMLSLLGLAVLTFIISAASMRTTNLLESRQHYKALEAQRDLADKAEASRFTDLRQYLDTQLRELRQRDSIAGTEFEKSMVNSQRELRTQLEQMNRMMMARLGELESRLDARFERMGVPPPEPVRGDPRLHADPVEPAPTVRHPL